MCVVRVCVCAEYELHGTVGLFFSSSSLFIFLACLVLFIHVGRVMCLHATQYTIFAQNFIWPSCRIEIDRTSNRNCFGLICWVNVVVMCTRTIGLPICEEENDLCDPRQSPTFTDIFRKAMFCALKYISHMLASIRVHVFICLLHTFGGFRWCCVAYTDVCYSFYCCCSRCWFDCRLSLVVVAEYGVGVVVGVVDVSLPLFSRSLSYSGWEQWPNGVLQQRYDIYQAMSYVDKCNSDGKIFVCVRLTSYHFPCSHIHTILLKELFVQYSTIQSMRLCVIGWVCVCVHFEQYVWICMYRLPCMLSSLYATYIWQTIDHHSIFILFFFFQAFAIDLIPNQFPVHLISHHSTKYATATVIYYGE